MVFIVSLIMIKDIAEIQNNTIRIRIRNPQRSSALAPLDTPRREVECPVVDRTPPRRCGGSTGRPPVHAGKKKRSANQLKNKHPKPLDDTSGRGAQPLRTRTGSRTLVSCVFHGRAGDRTEDH